MGEGEREMKQEMAGQGCFHDGSRLIQEMEGAINLLRLCPVSLIVSRNILHTFILSCFTLFSLKNDTAALYGVTRDVET